MFELNSGCGNLGERVEVFCLLSEYCRSNHTFYSQSFSNKQKTSASVPKSPPLFNSPSPATAQKPVNFISHICGLEASVGCERVERTFNTQRLKAQIWLMKFTGFVCSLSNELNIKSVYLIATRDLSNLWLQFFLSQNQGFMRLFEKTVLK